MLDNISSKQKIAIAALGFGLVLFIILLAVYMTRSEETQQTKQSKQDSGIADGGLGGGRLPNEADKTDTSGNLGQDATNSSGNNQPETPILQDNVQIPNASSGDPASNTDFAAIQLRLEQERAERDRLFYSYFDDITNREIAKSSAQDLADARALDATTPSSPIFSSEKKLSSNDIVVYKSPTENNSSTKSLLSVFDSQYEKTVNNFLASSNIPVENKCLLTSTLLSVNPAQKTDACTTGLTNRLTASISSYDITKTISDPKITFDKLSTALLNNCITQAAQDKNTASTEASVGQCIEDNVKIKLESEQNRVNKNIAELEAQYKIYEASLQSCIFNYAKNNKNASQLEVDSYCSLQVNVNSGSTGGSSRTKITQVERDKKITECITRKMQAKEYTNDGYNILSLQKWTRDKAAPACNNEVDNQYIVE